MLPSWIEWSLFAAFISIFILLDSLFTKLFPIVSIWEIREGRAFGERGERSGGELPSAGGGVEMRTIVATSLVFAIAMPERAERADRAAALEPRAGDVEPDGRGEDSMASIRSARAGGADSLSRRPAVRRAATQGGPYEAAALVFAVFRTRVEATAIAMP